MEKAATERKRAMDRDRIMTKRRDAGAVPRKEYEAEKSQITSRVRPNPSVEEIEMGEIPDELLRDAYAFRETMLPRADAYHGSAPLWYGWAIFDAYKAGVLAERERCASQVKAFRESVADSEDLETLEHVIRYGGTEP